MNRHSRGNRVIVLICVMPNILVSPECVHGRMRLHPLPPGIYVFFYCFSDWTDGQQRPFSNYMLTKYSLFIEFIHMACIAYLCFFFFYFQEKSLLYSYVEAILWFYDYWISTVVNHELRFALKKKMELNEWIMEIGSRSACPLTSYSWASLNNRTIEICGMKKKINIKRRFGEVVIVPNHCWTI